jgi:hypothetical protein
MASPKRNGIIYFLVLAAILASSFPASAKSGGIYIVNGNRLVEAMREYEKAERKDERTNYADVARYQWFVMGVHDALSGEIFCSPEQVTLAQVTAVVAKYLNAHPEEWDQPASVLVTKALNRVFPCRVATPR